MGLHRPECRRAAGPRQRRCLAAVPPTITDRPVPRGAGLLMGSHPTSEEGTRRVPGRIRERWWRSVSRSPQPRGAALPAHDSLPALAVERNAAAGADASGRPATDGGAVSLAPDRGTARPGSVLQLDAARSALAARDDQRRPQLRRGHPRHGLEVIHHDHHPIGRPGFRINTTRMAKLGRACNTLRGPRAPMSAPCGYPGSAPWSTPAARPKLRRAVARYPSRLPATRGRSYAAVSQCALMASRCFSMFLR